MPDDWDGRASWNPGRRPGVFQMKVAKGRAFSPIYFLAGARRRSSSNQFDTKANVVPPARDDNSTSNLLRSLDTSHVVVDSCRNSSFGSPARQDGAVVTSTVMSFDAGELAQYSNSRPS